MALQVFNSGFAEATESVMTFGGRDADDGYGPTTSPTSRRYADSDDEDDDTMLDTDDEQSMVDFSDGENAHSRVPTAPSVLSTTLTEDESDACLVETDTTEPRNVRQKVTHPSSPRRATTALSANPSVDKYPPRPMTRVVVRDASYSTYRSVLYYVSITTFHHVSSRWGSNTDSPRSTQTTSFLRRYPPRSSVTLLQTNRCCQVPQDHQKTRATSERASRLTLP